MFFINKFGVKERKWNAFRVWLQVPWYAKIIKKLQSIPLPLPQYSKCSSIHCDVSVWDRCKTFQQNSFGGFQSCNVRESLLNFHRHVRYSVKKGTYKSSHILRLIRHICVSQSPVLHIRLFGPTFKKFHLLNIYKLYLTKRCPSV